MKISSVRSDIVVVGGGIGGICAAVSASREGHTVSLIEKNNCFGGRLGFPFSMPFDDSDCTPQIYKRDSGIINEIWWKLFKNNQEGTYVGQSRVFLDWIRDQSRIKYFLNTELESVVLVNGKINRILSRDRNLQSSIAFLGKYFIDCTGKGAIAELANISGEKGVDKKENFPNDLNDTVPLNKVSYGIFVRIERCYEKCEFVCPDWVNVRWEDNHLKARLNLMKSLDAHLTGDHLIEWEGNSSEKNLDPYVIAFAAWDFLKNRSTIQETMADYKIVQVSENVIPPLSFRANGSIKLKLEDLVNERTWEDSVALGRVSIPQNFSRLLSIQDPLPLARPFGIPLRAMLTKECKNLFFAGASASSTELTSRSLGLPSCAAQMGAASGIIASMCIEKNRLPKTLISKGYLDELARKFYRRSHSFSLVDNEDFDNLVLEAKVNASSTLEDWTASCNQVEQTILTKRCLIQFPVTSGAIEKLKVHLKAKADQIFSVKILEGSGYHNSIPGICLQSDLIQVEGDPVCLEWFAKIVSCRSCWHFWEIVSEQEFEIPLFSNGLVGYVLHNERAKSQGFKTKFFSDFEPILSTTPAPSLSPKIEVYPKPDAYLPHNIANHSYRPNSLPGLWVSKPTDFKYPEFIELEWQEARLISCVEISFDPSYDFIYPAKPTRMRDSNFQSLVKNYRLYVTDSDGKSKLLVDVCDNQVAFRSHSFDPVEAKGIELEVISTHGLNRAQIYQVRVYQ